MARERNNVNDSSCRRLIEIFLSLLIAILSLCTALVVSGKSPELIGILNQIITIFDCSTSGKQCTSSPPQPSPTPIGLPAFVGQIHCQPTSDGQGCIYLVQDGDNLWVIIAKIVDKAVDDIAVVRLVAEVCDRPENYAIKQHDQECDLVYAKERVYFPYEAFQH